MAYETFERTTVRVEEPALTVAPIGDGRIALNAAACRLLKQSGVKMVKILWDKATCGIALQAARKSDTDAYSIAFGPQGNSASLSGKSFLRYIGWSSDRRQILPAKWDERQKMLEATLPSRFVGKGERKETKQEASTSE